MDKKLWQAAINNNVADIQKLLGQGANVNATKHGTGDDTALHEAAKDGYVEVLRVLLAAGADVEAKRVWDDTPLHMAARNGHVEAVRELLKAGADIDAKNYPGSTPLIKAARRGHVDVVRVLLEAGANVKVNNKKGKTAADVASGHNREAIKKLLQAAASNPQPLPSTPPKLPADGQLQRQHAVPHPLLLMDTQPETKAQQSPSNPEQPVVEQPQPITAGFQGKTVSLLHVLSEQQVLQLNTRLLQAGMLAVGQVVQGVLTCNPVVLVAACAMLLRAVASEVEAAQYCRQRIARVLARCAAMVPALQKLEHVLSPPQSTALETAFVQSLSKTLAILAQVLLRLEQLLARLQGGSGSRLASAMRALKGQCYQQELDELEQELRDCLSQLMAIIGISTFTQQVSEALQGKEELQLARWTQQNQEDWKQDLQQLEGQVLAVAGGVQALQQQLEEQGVELDGQRVALRDVLEWLQRMNAGSAVIAGRLQELHCKVDSIQDDVSTIKDQLEKLMLQGRKTQQWSPTEHLPQLAIAASRIDADAVRKAMDDASSGAFGAVVHAKLDAVSEVAVKVFNFKQRGVRDCKEAIREAVLLSMANHPQVVRCFGLVFDPESGKQSSIHGSLVMEWVGGGTLYEWLQEEEGEALGLRHRVQLALQLAAGLQHLHSKKLVHGDLKPENVLLMEATANQRVPQAKMCDFGLAKYTSASMVPTYTPKQAYTPLYASPERLTSFQRTPQDDVYAFGILMYFIATSSTPLNIPQHELKGAVLAGQRPAIEAWADEAISADEAPEIAVQQYRDLAKDCWVADPQLRPSSSSVHQRLTALARLLAG